MRWLKGVAWLVVGCAALASAQTAEELVAKNLQAKGGVEKIKAIKSLRMSGRFQQGSFTAQVGRLAMAPDFIRESITIQGMTQVQAYDGSTGWQISPFQGRKTPELLGEDDLRDLTEEADFYGPLVDYKEKGNTVEFLGHDTVDGDDALRLKVTLKNGDIVYYYLDPDTFLEIRTEKQQHVRGAVRETRTDIGSYKQVNGVYYPFSLETEMQGDQGGRSKITLDRIVANVALDAAEFRMPAVAAAPAPQKEPEPPVPKPKPPKPVPTKPPNSSN